MPEKQTQSGRSMVEVIGYMIVSMFLIAGVAKIISGAYSDYKMSQASLQIAELAGTIVKASAAEESYSEVVKIINGDISDTGSIKALKEKERKNFIPKSFRIAGDKIYNVFGGEVKVSVPSSEFEYEHPGDQFSISFEGLDREQCITMMSKEWNNNTVVDLYAIVLNAEHYWFWPVYRPSEAEGEYSLPVSMADVAGTGEGTNATGLCTESNNIMWVFN